MTAQRGFALFELLLAAALMLMVAVWASQSLVHRVSDATAQSAASWMLAVKNGTQSYLEQHGAGLRHADTLNDLMINGYQNWAAPQISELKADGHLSSGFPEKMRHIGGAKILILREGVCPGDDCRLAALIYSQRAFLKSANVVDEQMLAQWLLAANGFGGAVHPSQPETIRGHTFQYSNPLPGQAALSSGTVVMAISNEQLTQSAYLRVRDERDPQFQSDVTVNHDLVAGGVVSAGQHLHLASSAQWQQSCSSEGAVTRDRHYGLLVCTYGLWMSAGRSAGGFATNSNYGCSTPEGVSTANPVTRNCTCPPNYMPVLISEGTTKDESRGVTRGYLCVN